MTNKQELPVIGKRYKHKYSGHTVEVLPIVSIKSDARCNTEYGIETFYDMFEELPDQEPTSANNAPVDELTKEHIVDDNKMISDEVREAKEELKTTLGDYKGINIGGSYLSYLMETAQNLLNALDENNLIKSEDKNDKSIKEECIDSLKDFPDIKIQAKGVDDIKIPTSIGNPDDPFTMKEGEKFTAPIGVWEYTFTAPCDGTYLVDDGKHIFAKKGEVLNWKHGKEDIKPDNLHMKKERVQETGESLHGRCAYCGNKAEFSSYYHEHVRRGCCSYDCLSKLREKLRENPKSIWKPISELPIDLCEGLLYKEKGGGVFMGEVNGHVKGVAQIYKLTSFNPDNHNNDCVEMYCLLTDFITQQESLITRIERLEGNINQENK